MQGFIDVEMVYEKYEDKAGIPTGRNRVILALSAIVGVYELKKLCAISLNAGIYVGGNIPATTVRVDKTYEEVMGMIKSAQQS